MFYNSYDLLSYVDTSSNTNTIYTSRNYSSFRTCLQMNDE